MSGRKHPLANCEECPLYPEPGPVLGTGPEGTVKVAVVGEAPGFQEATVGRPFVGPSGQILNEVLRNNDIKREDVFVTNAVMCRPPQNATPTQEAIDACSPRLYAELIEHEPEYILATGAVAAKALGLKGAMQKLRVGPPRPITLNVAHLEGRVLRESLDTLVIPTWHPAYTLRLPDALLSLDYDVSKINKGATGQVWKEPSRVVADTRQFAMDAIADLWDMPGPFSVDIETGIDKDEQDVHADQRPLICIGVGYRPGGVVIFAEEMMHDDLVMGELTKLFRDKDLIMHNGKSDVAGLMSSMGPVNLRYDTMLEHYVLDERTGGHGLEPVAIELLGVPPWKHVTKPYLAKGKVKNFADIPRHILYAYNAIDCDVTLRLHYMLWPRIQEQGRTHAHDHMVKAGNELVYSEMGGIGFDMPYSEKLSESLQIVLAAVEKEMEELLGEPINPRSPQQLVKLFESRGWHVPTEKRKKTTGAKAIEKARIDGKYDSAPEALAFLDLLFKARDISKDDGTYVRGMQSRAVQERCSCEELPNSDSSTRFDLNTPVGSGSALSFEGDTETSATKTKSGTPTERATTCSSDQSLMDSISITSAEFETASIPSISNRSLARRTSDEDSTDLGRSAQEGIDSRETISTSPRRAKGSASRAGERTTSTGTTGTCERCGRKLGHRVHTTYTLHVATTGRLSSKDPNLQNIKKNAALRKQFIAGEGNAFLQGDYSQVEGRAIAVLSGDKYLGDLFRNVERDIFDEISVAMYGKQIKEKRTLLKSFFYGISYGRTAHGIAKDPLFNMDVQDAQRQLDAFKALIPGVLDWQEATWQLVQDQGYLETTFGRRRHFPLITNQNKEDVMKEALAFLPQSTASDICLRAFTNLRPALDDNYGNLAAIRLTIHDAIVTEVRDDMIVPVQNLQAEIMELSGNWWSRDQHSDVPFKVAFKSGKSWDQLD